MRLQGNLQEKFELNIKEIPDNEFKDDSAFKKSKSSQFQKDNFSSKSLSGLSKKIKKRAKLDIKKRKQNLINSIDNKTKNKNYLKIF